LPAQWLLAHEPEDWAEAGIELPQLESVFEILEEALGDNYIMNTFEENIATFEMEYGG